MIGDDRLKLKQWQCPLSLTSIQNMNCHQIQKVSYGSSILWFHIEFLQTNDATLQRHPQMAETYFSWIL